MSNRKKSVIENRRNAVSKKSSRKNHPATLKSQLETQLIISRNLNYLPEAVLDELMPELISIRRMTLGIRKSINKEWKYG